MANILDNPQHVAKIGYNGFPLRQRTLFSSSVGHLLPVFHHLLNPGDKVNIEVELKTRTKELDAAAMTSINEHVEFFFVPLEHLFKFFGDTFYGIQDINTSLFGLSEAEPVNDNFSEEYPWTIHFHQLFGDDDNTSNILEYYQNDVDDVGERKSAGFVRLCSHLGIPIESALDAASDRDHAVVDPRPFPADVYTSALFFLAYQKIYMDYYRISDRQANNPLCYNVDAGFNHGVIYLDPDSEGKFNDIFMIRYRPIRKDFFHAQQISPLFGSQSLAALNGSQIEQVNQWLSGLNAVTPLNPAGSSDVSEPSQVGIKNPLNSVPFAQFTPSNIRTMFAAEKLLEITRRAGKHYDAQTLAHFGVPVPQGISGEVYFLGEHSQKINIGDVIATAGTESTPLGEIGGKGYGYGKGRFKDFQAPCHGILMAIYSADVDFNYQQKGLDKLNTYCTPVDWYRPEYENLGMQPLFGYQTDLQSSGVYNSKILGWNYRYWELKMKYPRVLGSLAYNLDYWQVDIDAPTDAGLINFLVHPDFLDNIMLVNFSSSCMEDPDDPESRVSASWRSTMFDSDPLIHELFCNVVVASKMSTYGLPSL